MLQESSVPSPSHSPASSLFRKILKWNLFCHIKIKSLWNLPCQSIAYLNKTPTSLADWSEEHGRSRRWQDTSEHWPCLRMNTCYSQGMLGFCSYVSLPEQETKPNHKKEILSPSNYRFDHRVLTFYIYRSWKPFISVYNDIMFFLCSVPGRSTEGRGHTQLPVLLMPIMCSSHCHE